MKALVTFFAMMLVISAVAQNTFSLKTTPSEVIMISDGQRSGALNIVKGATPQMIAQVAPDNTFPMATNCFLIRTRNGKNILVDTGLGQGLFAGLENLGILPDSIHAILITHLHGDHIGGLLRDGKPAFPKATLMMSVLEAQSANENVRKTMGEYKLETFEPGILSPVAVYDNIMAMACYGHTIGHTIYFIDNIVLWGDMTHAMAFQMPYPNVGVTFDANSDLAIASRLRILRYIVANNYMVGGMHIPFPGVGTLQSNGKAGYIFTPVSSR